MSLIVSRKPSAGSVPALERFLTQRWGQTVVSRGLVHRLVHLPALVAEDNDTVIGCLTYRQDGPSSVEVVTIDAATPRRGVGTALLSEAKRLAPNVWLVTTNDNLPAQAFYRANGLRPVAVFAGAMGLSRRLKPSIPLLGSGGVPITDEWLFEWSRVPCQAPPPPGVALRPAEDADVSFLLRLRHRTMDRHIQASGADVPEEEHLRRVLFRFDCARIVLVSGRRCGLLKLARDAKTWHLIQIQVAPEFQGRGLGARLIGQITAEASEAGASVELDVLKVNPARRLYERFGFVVVGESAHSFDMRFSPDGQELRSTRTSTSGGAHVRKEQAMSKPDRTPSDIHPSLTYDDAPAAIDWLCKAFGFARRFVVPGPDNRVEHSELSLGTGVVMVSSPKPEDGRVSPRRLPGSAQALSVFVPDPDAHHAAAVAAGAHIVRPLQTEDYGARGYMARDPEGHLWYFGNYRPGEYWEASA